LVDVADIGEEISAVLDPSTKFHNYGLSIGDTPMRNLLLLSTTAAIFLLGAGAASAQNMNRNETRVRVLAAEQNTPVEKITPAEKTAPAEKIAPVLKSGQREAPKTTGQAAPSAPEADKKQVKSQTMEKGAPVAAAKDTPNEHSRSTTGQGAAAASDKLSDEQHTKITAILRQHKVAPAQLKVSVSVGTRVPDSVHFYPLPQEVYVIYPEWRGYNYIMVGDEIIVLDPRTHEIVAILQA
jgi:hypothetical protein